MKNLIILVVFMIGQTVKCEAQVVKGLDQTVLAIFAPHGAIQPKGLDKIKLGMNQEQVRDVIGSIYELHRSSETDGVKTFADTFFYYDPSGEEDKRMFADVYYIDGLVYAISFGFLDSARE